MKRILLTPEQKEAQKNTIIPEKPERIYPEPTGPQIQFNRKQNIVLNILIGALENQRNLN